MDDDRLDDRSIDGDTADTMSTADTETKPMKKKRSKYDRFGKPIVRFMFSHVGLCLLLSGYAVGGSFMFKAIEASGEHSRWKKTQEINADVEKEAANVKAQLKALNNSDASKQPEFNKVVMDFTAYVKNAASKGYVGKKDEESVWDVASGVLYCVSLITLIGYGHINVVTEMGQLIVIPYALLGIPLTLMFLANIGELLARSIRFIWRKISCYDKRKGLDLPDAEDIYGSARSGDRRAVAGAEEGEKDPKKKPKVHVPVWLPLLIIAAYVMLGAGIFTLWGHLSHGTAESGWTFLESTYFCVISLTTIGFGDLIPGRDNLSNLSGQLELAVSSIYIVIGLAFVSMGFNLMIEEVLSLSKLVAKRIGIHKDHDDRDKKIRSNLDNYVKRKVARI